MISSQHVVLLETSFLVLAVVAEAGKCCVCGGRLDTEAAEMDKLREAIRKLAAAVPAGGGGTAGRLMGLGAVGLTGLAYGGGNCLINVEGGHRAVMFHRFGGVQERVRGEGTHIIMPWFQRPILYDVRAKPRMIQSMTGSKGAPAPPESSISALAFFIALLYSAALLYTSLWCYITADLSPPRNLTFPCSA